MTRDQILGHVEAVACEDLQAAIDRLDALRRPALHNMRSTEATQIALAASEMIGRLRRELGMRNVLHPSQEQILL